MGEHSFTNPYRVDTELHTIWEMMRTLEYGWHLDAPTGIVSLMLGDTPVPLGNVERVAKITPDEMMRTASVARAAYRLGAKDNG